MITSKINFHSYCRMAVFVVSLFFVLSLQGQTPGLIYKPAGNALGKSVLDPNGDGFTSSSASGFSGTDYGTSSELNMVPLPIVGGEPVGDLTTGGGGGPTDIVSPTSNAATGSNQSCYILYRNVGGVYYLIFADMKIVVLF